LQCRLDLVTGGCNVANQNLASLNLPQDLYTPYTLMAVDAIIRGVKEAARKYCLSDKPCSDLLNVDRETKLFNCKYSVSFEEKIDFNC